MSQSRARWRAPHPPPGRCHFQVRLLRVPWNRKAPVDAAEILAEAGAADAPIHARGLSFGLTSSFYITPSLAKCPVWPAAPASGYPTSQASRALVDPRFPQMGTESWASEICVPRRHLRFHPIRQTRRARPNETPRPLGRGVGGKRRPETERPAFRGRVNRRLRRWSSPWRQTGGRRRRRPRHTGRAACGASLRRARGSAA